MQFKNIIAHEAEKKHLIHTVQENRISHAQMFLGPSGSGTVPMAIAYAQYILCQNKQDNDSCGACASCAKIQKHNHPDLHFSFPIHLSKEKHVYISDNVLGVWREILDENPYFGIEDWNLKLGNENKQGVIGKEESQKIISKLSLKSFEGGYKILIMWLPELMNGQASNKLLKFIEEPPHKTVFLLVAEDQEQIIATIRSRTQIVKLPRLKEKAIATYLETEKEISANDSVIIAHLAEGDVGKAIHLITEQTEANFNFENFVNWMRLCYQRNIAKSIDWVDLIAVVGRENQKSFLKFCLNMFRQCIVGHYAGNELVVLTDEQNTFLSKFSPFINSKNIVGLTEAFNEAYYHIERNASAKILFLDLSLKTFSLLQKK
ncbi:DNA polymerase III subunit delta' [Flavobacteriales bacterium]|nr:DNA polymerase III subunit delta' [Flavobacteriales bacterium]